MKTDKHFKIHIKNNTYYVPYNYRNSINPANHLNLKTLTLLSTLVIDKNGFVIKNRYGRPGVYMCPCKCTIERKIGEAFV